MSFEPVKFFLGTHHPHWLNTVEVPLFVSRRATCAVWALDSGGFTEISMHGRWMTSPVEYARDVRRYAAEIGGMLWAAPQDWMCEPPMLVKTGLTVREHQARTIRSVQELRSLGASVIPVLQGWAPHEYHEHIAAYELAGIDLRAEPVVGIGSVCRRQNALGAAELVASIAATGVRLHGFGFKTLGLARCKSAMVSADSLAWSFRARKLPPMAGCVGHVHCNNCQRFALQWRRELLARLDVFDVYEYM